MTERGPLPLVPGELRGYRRFEVGDDGLYPIWHREAGRWAAGREVARCVLGEEHAAPDRDCTCGLYGWYDPIGMAGGNGLAIAVVAASGRVVLGDRGFRAAQARVVAVAPALALRCQPFGAARARRMLGERYPDVPVYRSARAMIRTLPPQDVRELGIDVDRAPQRARRAAYVVCVVAILAGCILLLRSREPVADAVATWWLVWCICGLFAYALTGIAIETYCVSAGNVEVVRDAPDDLSGSQGGGNAGAPG